MVIMLIGVSGAGKTTIGRLLARRLGWPFVEGDEFHSPANVEKMRSGIPLSDADRWPWLDAIRAEIDDVLGRGGSAVVACSALKRAYRDRLRRDGVTFVHLEGDPDLLRRRIRQRQGHFFDDSLLTSQLETLEKPERALTVDVSDAPHTVVERIVEGLALVPSGDERPRR